MVVDGGGECKWKGYLGRRTGLCQLLALGLTTYLDNCERAIVESGNSVELILTGKFAK